MVCCNVKCLSKVVASLTIVFCIVAAVLDIIFVCSNAANFQQSASTTHSIKSEIGLQYGILIIVMCVIGLIAAMLFLSGLHKENLTQMVFFVYFWGVYLILTAISTICIYTADLVTDKTHYHAFLGFIYNCLALGLQILFSSPIFVIYRRLRKAVLHPV